MYSFSYFSTKDYGIKRYEFLINPIGIQSRMFDIAPKFCCHSPIYFITQSKFLCRFFTSPTCPRCLSYCIFIQ